MRIYSINSIKGNARALGLHSAAAAYTEKARPLLAALLTRVGAQFSSACTTVMTSFVCKQMTV